MSKAIQSVKAPSGVSSTRIDLSDEELLRLYCQAADREAFTQLVSRYERELFSYLRRYLGDASMAEDAFQATFLQVHLKCDQFEEGRKVRPWLYTVATNQAIDAQRRNKRHRSVSLNRSAARDADGDVGSLVDLLVSKEPNPESNLDASQRQEWVRAALEQLPDQLRAAIDLVYYQGFKYREAADILGIPVGTVKSRLHTAILKLNEAWMQSENSLPD